MNTAVSKLMWVAVSLLGAFALGTIALVRDEPINAAWLVVAAVCSYLVGYRFYSAFIANTVFKLDENRKTPAHTMTDGLDYVPTNKYVLFGHHFAAIAGAGPLVGPVLAAQMGYLPGTLWIIVGAVFAGCVQDFIMLVFSARHGGQSLGQMIKNIMGREAGLVAQFGIFLIMTILLAVLGLVVVKALAESPWGTFTVAMTIPIALFMGLYMRFVRPGRIMEISVIGVVMLMAALIGGKYVGDSEVWGPIFTLTGPQIAWGIIIYGFVAAIMPVWMMQAPRDYLSTFLKIGTILGLAIGIIVTLPQLSFPAVSKFVDGTGPAFSGALFPFLFITIACGAISGFHALIASGTTPKMLDKEPEARAIGYGAMAMESFVAIMALTAACVLDPGEYFAVNSPAGLIGTTPESAAAAVTAMGFTITPEQLKQAAVDVGEGSILSRTGGAPTLALGMAHILSSAVGGEGAKAFWYHFAILFEALFILTTVTAGTRVARFMIQDFLSLASPELGKTTSWTGNVIGTGVSIGAWGYILYQGVIDPFGGINSLWALFGISNQMLAAIALTFTVVAFVKYGYTKYIIVPGFPLAALLLFTVTAGIQKIWHPKPSIGFLAHADMINASLATGTVLAPARSLEEMERIVFNDYLDAALGLVFLAVVIIMLGFAARSILQMRRGEHVMEGERARA